MLQNFHSSALEKQRAREKEIREAKGNWEEKDREQM